MKRIIGVITLLIIILMCNSAYAIVHSTVRSTPRSTVKSTPKTTHSTTHSSSKVTGAKTYTTPKNFKSKFNSNNIKTEKINSNPKVYKNFSTTNIFKPNFWTAMWAFQCINNDGQATEQDIAKELEERGYTEEEIKEILAEGKKAEKQEEANNNRIATIVDIISIAILIIGVIVVVIISRS